MRCAVAVVAACALVIAALGGAGGAGAQEAIAVVNEEARNEFPTGVAFSVSFNAPAEAEDVRLRYEVAPDGTGATAIASCVGAATTTCTYTLTSGRGIYIIPGAEITYHWDIEDADGNRTETASRLYVHADTRFEFTTVSDGGVTVHYYADEARARAVLAAAVETLAEVGELEGAVVDFPVKVFLYDSADDMQLAISPGIGRGLRILGEVFYSDTTMVSAEGSTLDNARHEIAHIVTGFATKGPFGVPDWMKEGISVYAEREPISKFDIALESAINSDRVLTFAEMNSSASGDVASTAFLYYGQAGSIINFLVETYGAEKFAELLKTFKDGSRIDPAFESVYGFDQFGLENAWRESVGLEARAPSAVPSAEATDEVSAQPSVTGGDDDDSDSVAPGGDDDGTPVVTIAIVAVLVAAVVGAGAVMWRVARSRF